MHDPLWLRLDLGARLSIPFVTTLLCAFLGVVAWPLPHFGAVTPPLVLVTLFYWSIHRPDLFRPWMAFLIGFLNDLINDLPLGLTALLFVALSHLILTQRRFFVGQSFLTLWCGFAFTSFIFALAEWILMGLFRFQLIPILPVFMQTLLVVAIFPIPCWLLIRTQRLALPRG